MLAKLKKRSSMSAAPAAPPPPPPRRAGTVGAVGSSSPAGLSGSGPTSTRSSTAPTPAQSPAPPRVPYAARPSKASAPPAPSTPSAPPSLPPRRTNTVTARGSAAFPPPPRAPQLPARASSVSSSTRSTPPLRAAGYEARSKMGSGYEARGPRLRVAYQTRDVVLAAPQLILPTPSPGLEAREDPFTPPYTPTESPFVPPTPPGRPTPPESLSTMAPTPGRSPFPPVGENPEDQLEIPPLRSVHQPPPLPSRPQQVDTQYPLSPYSEEEEPDAPSRPQRVLNLPQPYNMTESLRRFQFALTTAYDGDELAELLLSTKPAQVGDIHTLYAAAAYANVWIVLDREFLETMRRAEKRYNTDFCTVVAMIHLVLHRLPVYEFIETEEDDAYDVDRPVFREELEERPHRIQSTARRGGKHMTKAISKLHRSSTLMVPRGGGSGGSGGELSHAASAMATTAGKWRKGLKAKVAAM